LRVGSGNAPDAIASSIRIESCFIFPIAFSSWLKFQ